MDLKLLASTFVLIFLAELGDKTQLYAMASSATSKSPWTVFLAASLALVFSSFLAAMLGGKIGEYVPEYLIKGGAGVLFIIFGLLLLREVIAQPAEGEGKPAAASTTEAGGFLAGLALEMAASFEEKAAEDYIQLAEKTEEPELRQLFLALSREESAHLDTVRHHAQHHGEAEVAGTEPSAPAPIQSPVAPQSDAGRAALASAVEHERKTAAFYRELGKNTMLPALQEIFADLAREEEEHARRLSRWQT